MRPEDFGPAAPVELVRNLDGHWAFVPRSLPPRLELTQPLFNAVTDATLALGQLAGLGRKLPNPQRLVRMFLRREAELSSRIEQTYARVQTMVP
jgi:Fic family protein